MQCALFCATGRNKPLSNDQLRLHTDARRITTVAAAAVEYLLPKTVLEDVLLFVEGARH